MAKEIRFYKMFSLVRVFLMIRKDQHPVGAISKNDEILDLSSNAMEIPVPV